MGIGEWQPSYQQTSEAEFAVLSGSQRCIKHASLQNLQNGTIITSYCDSLGSRFQHMLRQQNPQMLPSQRHHGAH